MKEIFIILGLAFSSPDSQLITIQDSNISKEESSLESKNSQEQIVENQDTQILEIQEPKIQEFGFIKKEKEHYKLVRKEELDKNESVCLTNNLCSLFKLSEKGEQSYKIKDNEKDYEAINSYENTLYLINGFVVGNLELEKRAKDLKTLKNPNPDEVLKMLLEDKDEFLKQDEDNYLGKEISRTLVPTLIFKDKIFFYRHVNYSFSSANHPSFDTSGFALNLEKMALEFYTLGDIVKDNKEFRKFVVDQINAHIKDDKKFYQNEEYYFKKDYTNLFKQDVVFQHKSLYINLRVYLGEVFRSKDDFKLTYEELKPFLKDEWYKRLFKE